MTIFLKRTSKVKLSHERRKVGSTIWHMNNKPITRKKSNELVLFYSHGRGNNIWSTQADSLGQMIESSVSVPIKAGKELVHGGKHTNLLTFSFNIEPR